MPQPNVPFLRTPSSRFHNLPDFPYTPYYLQYGNLRMAYIDESSSPPGSSSASQLTTFLCLHGQPTWSYLYRKMIPVLLNYTTLPNSRSTPQPFRRIICPDLFGFGRSDKPTHDSDYTFSFHRASLIHFITALNLSNITLVVQDWGGLLGLTLPLALPGRIKRLVVMNTSIAIGQTPTQGFEDWRAFSNRTPDMKVGAMLGRSCRHLTQTEADAYDAPFPSVEFKAGVRRFPQLVMTSAEMEGVDVSKASLRLYSESDVFGTRDIFMACGMKDPVLGPAVMEGLARAWKNGCYYGEIQEAGHFVQEWGGRVAEMAIGVFEGRDVEGVRTVEAARFHL